MGEEFAIDGSQFGRDPGGVQPGAGDGLPRYRLVWAAAPGDGGRLAGSGGRLAGRDGLVAG
jgi:hypothetical protein